MGDVAPVDDVDIVAARIHAHAAELSGDPVAGQLLWPRRVDLEPRNGLRPSRLVEPAYGSDRRDDRGPMDHGHCQPPIRTSCRRYKQPRARAC